MQNDIQIISIYIYKLKFIIKETKLSIYIYY